MLAAQVDAGEARIGTEVAAPHGADQTLPGRPVVGGDQHIAVARRVQAVRCHVGQVRPLAGRHMAQLLEGRHEALHHRERGLVQCRVHQLAAAAGLAVEQRHHGAERAVHRGQIVGGSQGDAAGRPVRVAGQLADAGEGVADRPVAGPRGVRAGLAVAADAHHHQAGVERLHRVPAEAQALHHAGPVVLDQDIGVRQQPGEHLLAGRLLEIDRDAALAALDRHRLQRHAVGEQAHLAHRVALGRLDLDDLGAEVGQQPATGRAGEGVAQLDHAHAGQRAGGNRLLRHQLDPRPSSRSSGASSSRSRPKYATVWRWFW